MFKSLLRDFHEKKYKVPWLLREKIITRDLCEKNRKYIAFLMTFAIGNHSKYVPKDRSV